jgi:hypothetical protein
MGALSSVDHTGGGVTLRTQFAAKSSGRVQKGRGCNGGMMNKALACTMFLGVFFSLPALAAEQSLTFKGGIGVIPVSSVSCVPAATPCVAGPQTTVTINQNIVRGVQPAGQIWVISDLTAKVSSNGSITVQGSGLVFGGGNDAGVSAGLNVLATLSCSSSSPFGLRVRPETSSRIA